MDYYSKFPFIWARYGLKSRSVINAFMSIFSELRIPEKLTWQWIPASISRVSSFSMKDRMEFVTSSPEYQCSHGLIERHMQMLKKLIIKCTHSNEGVAMALLILRATLLWHCMMSPAELISGGKFKTNLPAKISPPLGHENHAEVLRSAQEVGAEYYNHHTKELPELFEG